MPHMDVRLGRYQHYKGGEYIVEAIGKIEATQEDVVIYHDNEGKWWVRPVNNFCAKVLNDDQPVQRFTYLG